MTEHTPDVWCDILPAGFTLAECRAAVGIIIRRGERSVDLGGIIAEVRRVRADAAERERTRVLLDPDACRAKVEADDAAFMRKLAAHTGAQLKAIPPADHEGAS